MTRRIAFAPCRMGRISGSVNEQFSVKCLFLYCLKGTNITYDVVYLLVEKLVFAENEHDDQAHVNVIGC